MSHHHQAVRVAARGDHYEVVLRNSNTKAETTVSIPKVGFVEGYGTLTLATAMQVGESIARTLRVEYPAVSSRMSLAAASADRRRRRIPSGPDTRPVLTQITQLVATNEQMQRENRGLAEENERLLGELTEIGSALGGLTGGRRRRVRRAGAAPVLPVPAPRRTRRPITDPEVLARRRAALAKARAARAEKLAAARAAALGE